MHLFSDRGLDDFNKSHGEYHVRHYISYISMDTAPVHVFLEPLYQYFAEYSFQVTGCFPKAIDIRYAESVKEACTYVLSDLFLLLCHSFLSIKSYVIKLIEICLCNLQNFQFGQIKIYVFRPSCYGKLKSRIFSKRNINLVYFFRRINIFSYLTNRNFLFIHSILSISKK